MSNNGRNTKKNPFAKVNEGSIISVKAYLDKITEWRLWPSKAVNGEVFIVYRDALVPYNEFVKLQPKPSVADFKVRLNNADKTKDWMYDPT